MTRLVKTLPIQTYKSAVDACKALLESERLYRKPWHKDRDRIADAKHNEALAHAKKVIAACEGD